MIGERMSVAWVLMVLSLHQVLADGVFNLNDQNVDQVLRDHDIVLVNFYADWCRFSQILKPTFQEAGTKVANDPNVARRVAFAMVDCDKETNIASRYRINKYPTLKMFRNGDMVKKEYRGQRSVESLFQFAQEQAKDPIEEIHTIDKLHDLDSKKRHIIGYFDSKESDNYKTLFKVATMLQDECLFHAAFGEVSQGERIAGDRVAFRHNNDDTHYSGELTAFDVLHPWIVDKCMPLVREITFENAEELTEEGLPFLILFHDANDKEIVDTFNQEVARQLVHDKSNINFLTADGHKFAHPLHHLGKSTDDLPILAIDSFRHMYLFPHDVRDNLQSHDLLKKFVEDLHNGKLHREFHHGPDPTETPKIEEQPDSNNIPRDGGAQPPSPPKNTSPPKSTFRKLAPSRNRYTILKDEL